MQQLTAEEKAKVFAMYLGCEVVHINGDSLERFGRVLVGIGGINDGGYCYGRLKNKASTASCFVENFKLLLTPLTEVTEEDAVEIMKQEHPNVIPSLEILKFDRSNTGRVVINFRYKHPDKRMNLPDGYSYSSWATNFNNNMGVDIFQYLNSRGYDVPLFFSPNHPNNGKTAHECGIAVYNTLNNKK